MDSKGFTRAIDVLVRVIIAACCVLMAWLIAITGYQVFGRYVLNDSPVWVERSALLTILYISLPMAAVGVRQRFHMNVSFIIDRLGARGQAIAGMLVDLGLGLFGTAMAWFGGVIAHRVWSAKMAVLPLPEGVTYLPLVICGTLLVIFAVERLVAEMQKLRVPAPAPQGATEGS
jgi:TRAP-type C4-dicarboxylate transport system permease small subunit